MDKFNTPKAKCLWANLQKPNIASSGDYRDSYQITLIMDQENSEHKSLLN